MHTGAPGVPVGAGNDKTWGSLGHGAPGLGWQQDQCGPISKVAFEQADDSSGCSTMLVRQVSEDGVLAAASPQYPNLLDFFSVVLHLDQQVKKWMLLQTIHAPVALWGFKALVLAKRP